MLPLVVDATDRRPFRVNLILFVNLLDHGSTQALLLNIIGNFAMLIPAIYVGCYEGMDAHTREKNIEIASLMPGLKFGCDMVPQHFQTRTE